MIDPQVRLKLQERITRGLPCPVEPPSHLGLNRIEIIEAAFQHRDPGIGPSQVHAANLAASLKANPKAALEPITVFWIGDGWACVDGHHRIAAYAECGWQDPVPVEVFSGTLDEAILRALSANSRDKLAMSRYEKQDAAWALVCCGVDAFSKKEIVVASGISDGTVGNMRRVRKQLLESHPDKDLCALGWIKARLLSMGKEPAGMGDADEYQRKHAQAIADKLVRTFGTRRLSQSPEILAMALEIYDKRLPEHLAEYWGPVDDEEDGGF